jgi:hypothetical protein
MIPHREAAFFRECSWLAFSIFAQLEAAVKALTRPLIRPDL